MITKRKPGTKTPKREQKPRHVALSVFRDLFYVTLTALLLLMVLSLIQSDRAVERTSLNPQSDEPSALAGDYLAARFAEDQGDMETATQLYGAALSKYPGNPKLLERTYTRMVLGGDLDKAVHLARRHLDMLTAELSLIKSEDERKELLLKSRTPRLVIAIGYLRKKEFNEVVELLAPLHPVVIERQATLQNQLDHALYSLLLGWTYVALERFDEGIEIAESGALDSMKPFFDYELALMKYLAGQNEQAVVRFEAMDPSQQSFRSLNLGYHLYTKVGAKNKAEAILAQFTGQNPEFTPGKIETRDFKEIYTTQEGAVVAVSEIFQELGTYVLSHGATETARFYYHIGALLDPSASYAWFMLGQVAEGFGWNQKAEEFFSNVRHDSGFFEVARIKAALAGSKEENIEEVEEKLLTIADDHPHSNNALLSLGDLLLRQKDYAKAINIYSRVLSRIYETKGAYSEQDWSIFYARGIGYERTQQWPQAETDFKKALELTPEQPDVLNYLGYSWLIQGMNLEEAERMLKIAIRQRPNDAHILDSYGWALHEQKRYDEALYFLEKANLLMPQESTINDHLGDLYWRLGRKREAYYQWQRALTFGPEPEDEEKIKVKLDRGLAD